MEKLHKIIGFPLPVILAVVQSGENQLPIVDQIGHVPDFLLGAVAAIWVLFYILERLGKIPGIRNNSVGLSVEDREAIKAIQDILSGVPSFTDSDRQALHKATNLLATRDDDGFERILVMARTVKEIKMQLDLNAKKIEQLSQKLDTR